jgi:hypothetical protein
MIFVHFLFGVIFGQSFGNYLFFILGSVFPDVDHVYVILKNRFFSFEKIMNSIKFEKKFGVRYKTQFFHSLLGLVLFSVVICFFNVVGAICFSVAYFFHLLVDLFDVDEKYYFYPLRIKFSGWLPIWSSFEKILTIVLIIFIFFKGFI